MILEDNDDDGVALAIITATSRNGQMEQKAPPITLCRGSVFAQMVSEPVGTVFSLSSGGGLGGVAETCKAHAADKTKGMRNRDIASVDSQQRFFFKMPTSALYTI
jgi:hypothetical protein